MRALVGLGAVVALLALPAPAPAGLLEPVDATELAQALADAQSEQDVCYGWTVANNFGSTPDVGSSTAGPDQPLDPAGCPKYVILTGSIDYACDTCDFEDSAEISIQSNLASPPTVEDLERLGWDEGDLLGDQDDIALFSMVSALPLLVAEHGEAPFVRPEKAPNVPATDIATDSPGSDFLRDAWAGLLVFLFILLLAVTLFVRQRRPTATPRT